MSTFNPRPPLTSSAATALKAHAVPLRSLENACKGCEHEDSDDLDSYPKGFDVDLDSEMLGSVNPYGRQILISTGKSDWEREVTDDGKSLPGMIKLAYEAIGTRSASSNGNGGGFLGKLSNKLKRKGEGDLPDGSIYKGLYPSLVRSTPSSLDSEPPRISILTSSFLSNSNDPDDHSVIVLPDFKIVHHVASSPTSAQSLVESHLLASIGRAGSSTVSTSSTRSYPLPYRALVLICSHKKRDKRCHIAAPLLIAQFHHHLEKHDLVVDERGDDLGGSGEKPMEEWPEEERERRMEEELKGVKKNEGRVGVFKCSHIGGHRYAGNVIIYLPNGTSIWYGRVTPRDVGAIVQTTLIEGKVIPELLRGGLGLSGISGAEGLLSW